MKLLTPDEMKGFKNAIECHICEKPFALTNVKHRDHCHFTGKYRGAAHQEWNLNHTKSYSIPIVFYNLSGEDSYFLIKSLTTEFNGELNLKYVKGTKINLRFIDSLRIWRATSKIWRRT